MIDKGIKQLVIFLFFVFGWGRVGNHQLNKLEGYEIAGSQVRISIRLVIDGWLISNYAAEIVKTATTSLKVFLSFS